MREASGAALATKHEGEQFRSRVQLLLASIVPGLPDLDAQLSPEQQLSRAVEGNVRWTVRQILDSPAGTGGIATELVGGTWLQLAKIRIRHMANRSRRCRRMAEFVNVARLIPWCFWDCQGLTVIPIHHVP